ncbi:MAG: TatD family hydrolase [Candidatus Omnitrophota bacterium]
MLIDTHCHLDFPEFSSDIEEVIQRAKAQGIDYLINIGADLERSRKSVELAKRYDCIYATVGIHPHDADKFKAQDIKILKELAQEKKVLAIGETGLDYYKNYSTKENQVVLFKSLLELAKEAGLPLVIHSRQAETDTLKILKEASPIKAVVHCFSGGEEFLKSCLDMGFKVSFTCNITYPAKLPNRGRDPVGGNSAQRDKKAVDLRQLVKLTPLESLMLETDAPYLSPEGFRGRRNEPYQIRFLAEEVARIKEISFEQVAQETTRNAKEFFRI